MNHRFFLNGGVRLVGMKVRPWQRGSFWRFPLILGAFGAALPLCIYALCHWGWFFDAMSRSSNTLFFFCPPYLLSMAFDNMRAKDRIEVVIFLMSPANGVLYFLAGIPLAAFGKFINRF
jgi:hypothetical protein